MALGEDCEGFPANLNELLRFRLLSHLIFASFGKPTNDDFSLKKKKIEISLAQLSLI